MSEGQLRLLIVDDDPDIILAETLFLEGRGYEVVPAHTHEEALAALGNHAFDLAILDFDLGRGQTGLELAESIRAAGLDVPAILLTAVAGDAPVVGALRAGLRDFVRKGDGYLAKLGEAVPRVIRQVAAEREQRAAEARELQARTAREESAKALQRFAKGLTHNLNNMLTSVIGFSELELRRQEQGSPTRMALEKILHGGLRAAAVVKQLAAASRRQAPVVAAVSLRDALERVEQVLRSLGRAEVVVELEPAPDLAPVLVDRSHLDQILLNLVIRACDAMTEGGTLRFEAVNVDVAEAVDDDPARPAAGRYVRLSVGDTGPSLDEEALLHALEPFHDVRAQRHGSGLELAAVYGFVQLNKGHIDVQRGPAGGTVIAVHFLRAE